MQNYTYTKSDVKKNVFTFEVKADYSLFQVIYDNLFSGMAKSVKLAGFRPGKGPKDLIERQIGYEVLDKATGRLLPQIAIEIIETEKLNPLYNLEYDLKELDKDNGIVFTFTLYNQPEIKIDDLKKIKIKEVVSEVKDAEIDDAIRNLIKSRVPEEKWKLEDKKDSSESFTITDGLVAEMNFDGAKTVEDIKKKIKDALLDIKKTQNEEEFTYQALKEAIKVCDFALPQKMIEEQITLYERDFGDRLNKIKLDKQGYLKTQGMTEAEMRQKWSEDSEFRISSDIMLVNLAVNEKILPTEEEINLEIEKMEQPSLKQAYSSPKGKETLKTLIARDKALKSLVKLVRSNNA